MFKRTRIIVCVVASFAFVFNAYASNRTHIAETYGAGNGEADISYDALNVSFTGNYVTGGTSAPLNQTYTSNTIQADLYYGVTDRLDVGFFIPLSLTTDIQGSFSYGGTQYALDTKTNGMGDIGLSARYLLLDKQQDSLSWLISATYQPSSAPYGAATAQQTQNGVVTTQGVTGQSGNGYSESTLKTVFSVPTGLGDAFLQLQYQINGSRTSGGVVTTNGNMTAASAGIEIPYGDATTFMPEISIASIASGTSGTTIYQPYTAETIGILTTQDFSKHFSLQLYLTYNIFNSEVSNFANGDTFTFSGNGPEGYIKGLFFF